VVRIYITDFNESNARWEVPDIIQTNSSSDPGKKTYSVEWSLDPFKLTITRNNNDPTLPPLLQLKDLFFSGKQASIITKHF
jgi:hypothetical protein